MNASARQQALWPVAAMALAVAYLIWLNPHLDLKAFNAHDPANYLLGAQSIWRGEGFGLRFANVYMPMKLQPPGVYVLMAPIVGFFGMNFVAIKLSMVALAGLMAWACLRMFRRFLPSDQSAGLAVAVLMASPLVFGLSHQVLAEIPLMLCCAVGLVSLDRYLRAPEGILSRWGLFAAVATSAAYFFKGVGLAVLLGGWCLLVDHRWRRWDVAAKLLALTVVVSLPVVLWQLRCQHTPGVGFHGQTITTFYLLRNPYVEGSPVASLADLLVRMRHNLVWGMAANVGASVVAPLYFIRESLVGFVLGLPVMAWLAWQWARSCRRQLSVLEGYTLVGMAALVLYFHGYAERYIGWLYPVFVIYAFRGLSRLPARWQRVAPSGMLGLALGSTLIAAIGQWHNPYGLPTVQDYVAMAQKAKAELPPSSRCLAPMETHWQVLTQHACVVAGMDQLPGSSAGMTADYAVALSDPAHWRAQPIKDFERDLIHAALSTTAAVEHAPAAWTVIDHNATFRLLKAVR